MWLLWQAGSSSTPLLQEPALTDLQGSSQPACSAQQQQRTHRPGKLISDSVPFVSAGNAGGIGGRPKLSTTDDDQLNENGEIEIPFVHSGNELSIKIRTGTTHMDVMAKIDVLAKIDSGADINFVSKPFFDTLPNNIKRKLHGKAGTCTVASDHKIRMFGEVRIPLEIQGQKVSALCEVLEYCTSDLFLGQTFLKKHRATLKFGEVNTLSLIIAAPVLSKDFHNVKPFEEIVVPGICQTSIPDKTEGYISPFNGIVGSSLSGNQF